MISYKLGFIFPFRARIFCKNFLKKCVSVSENAVIEWWVLIGASDDSKNATDAVISVHQSRIKNIVTEIVMIKEE